MVVPEVQAFLSQAISRGGRGSLVLEWTVRPGPEVFAGVSSRRERQQRAEEFYSRSKRELLEILSGFPDIEVKDLPGSGNAILSGPTPELRELAAPGGALDQDPGIRVFPNLIVTAAGPSQRSVPG